jgi:hypothetical protein
MKTETTIEPRPRRHLAIMGSGFLVGDKRGFFYMPVEKVDGVFVPEANAESVAYSKPLMRGNIGRVFSVEYDAASERRAVFSATAMYAGTVGDESLVEQWKLDSGCVDTTIESKRKMNEELQTALDELIARLREYIKGHRLHRRQIIAYILAKLL